MATTAAPPSQEVDECLGCHSDPSLSTKLRDGTTVSLTVDGKALAESVHGKRIGCVGCHPAEREIPHPAAQAADRSAFSAHFRDACRRCHFDNYTKALDGVHFQQLAAGNPAAPFCTDCHGFHDVRPPGRPRTHVSETCSTCHSEIYDAWKGSVHGRSLLEHGGADAPVCTDCHRSHDIVDPRTPGARLASTDACARCHGDRKRMEKYGLSTGVVKSWLADFHGATASLEKGSREPKTIVALCIDCHGVHDVARVSAGRAAIRANLAAVCRRCHPGATANFPDAWLSHFEPSPKRAPLVWAVAMSYRVLIPFMIGGLALQVLLHIWRVVVNR